MVKYLNLHYFFQASVDKSSKSNIREKLIRFFLRRPTMDDLFKKGIIRNEPVFGSTLRELEANSEGSLKYSLLFLLMITN